MRKTQIVFALALCAVAGAFATGQGEGAGAAAGTGGALFGKPVTLSMMLTSHPSYPYQADWYIWKAIEKKTGVTIEAEPYGENYTEKFQIKIASGNLNDISYVADIGLAIRYGSEGAFVEILSNGAKLPNFTKWKAGREKYLTNYMSMDGKMYVFPNEGLADVDKRAWFYRKDIFDANKLTPPKTTDELYAVAKKLKEIYPKSYPYTFRNNLGHFAVVGPQWGTGWMLYFNGKQDKFAFGPTEDNFRQMVEYYAKLYKEKLIPPDFMSLNTNGWQNLVSTDNVFILCDYLLRIDFFQSAMKPTNAAVTMKYMSPPKGASADSVPKVMTDVSIWGYSVSAGSKKVAEAMKYIDWMYSPEGAEVTGWGEEGVTYRVKDGRRYFYMKDQTPAKDILAVCKEYGMHTIGTVLLIDPDAEIGACGASQEMFEAYKTVANDSLPKVPAVNFMGDDQKTVQGILGPIDTVVREQLAKFVLGTRPMSEWDAYVREVEKLGIGKLLEMYNSAYAKMRT